MPAMPRVAILGAGPAGLSAALWLKNLGLAPWLLEAAPRPGGMQNLNFLPNDWVLGHVGLTGPELIDRFVAHVEQAGIPIRRGCHPLAIDGKHGAFTLHLGTSTGEQPIRCAAVLLATGTRFRGPEVLAATRGLADVPAGRIAYGPYAFAALDACAGQRILVIGGGDNAYENVRLLVERGARVDLVLRSPPRAQRHLQARVEQAEADGHCRVHHGARVVALAMAGNGLQATLATSTGDASCTIERLHVLAGYEPNLGFLDALTPPLREGLQHDTDGYLRVDAEGRTAVAGLYAAGDLCNPIFPSVVSAIAQGAHAAKTIERDLRQH